MVRTVCSVTALLCCSGCASSLAAFYNRSVVEDNIANRVSTVSLSADRRTVVVATNDKTPLFVLSRRRIPPPG
jgi:coenzyme F420-reducing hydrogenase gamma subunit